MTLIQYLQSPQFAIPCAGGMIVVLLLTLLFKLNQYEAKTRKQLKEMDKTKGGK